MRFLFELIEGLAVSVRGCSFKDFDQFGDFFGWQFAGVVLHELWGEVDVDWGGETGGEVELVKVGLQFVLVFFEGV